MNDDNPVLVLPEPARRVWLGTRDLIKEGIGRVQDGDRGRTPGLPRGASARDGVGATIVLERARRSRRPGGGMVRGRP